MSKLQKRNFVLLEILISLFLLSILLTFLISSMTESIKMEVNVTATRKILLARQQLQTRLQDLFLSVAKHQIPAIYTQPFPKEKKESLIVYFDNGIDPDPLFSGSILGRIYLDEKNQLILALWPLNKGNKNKPWRKEVLLDHVTDFQFQFLGEKQTKEDRSVTAHLAWHKKWPRKRIETPSMVRLTVVQENVEIPFAFFLSSVEPFVTYWSEGYQS